MQVAVNEAPSCEPPVREKLLQRAAQHVLAHGLADGSLRSIAGDIDTSHRMLIYHFGSADAFWEAVLAELRAHDLRLLGEATADGRTPTLEQVWEQVASVRYRPIARLLFQIYGEALKERQRFTRFLSEVVDGWLQLIAEGLYLEFELTRAQAMQHARIRLAVVRGLLLDLLTTGNHKATTAALRTFSRSQQLQRRAR